MRFSRLSENQLPRVFGKHEVEPQREVLATLNFTEASKIADKQAISVINETNPTAATYTSYVTNNTTDTCYNLGCLVPDCSHSQRETATYTETLNSLAISCNNKNVAINNLSTEIDNGTLTTSQLKILTAEERQNLLFSHYLEDIKTLENLVPVSIVKSSIYQPTRGDLLQEKTALVDQVYSIPGKTPGLIYSTVDIVGNRFKALIDSGASKTFVGPSIRKIAKKNALFVNKNITAKVTTPLGHTEEIRETIQIPIKLQKRVRVIEARFLESLDQDCILGLDALHDFGIIADFSNFTYTFSSKPFDRYTFEKRFKETTEKTESCYGLRELSSTEENMLQKFLEAEIPKTPEKLGTTSLVVYSIDVNGHPAIKQRPYPQSSVKEKALFAEVDKMLDNDIIERSSSDWSSPILMVRKPNNTYRFCLDLRKVNAVTKKDAYPLPLMTSILDKLRVARYISTIDLSQAFFQIPLEEKSREITAFAVPGKGLYQFKRLPYGLTNSPAVFQRLVDTLIGPELQPNVYSYIDDLIIVTETFEDHLRWLKIVFDKLKHANLAINEEKCKFCQSEVKYLGFIVNKNGLQVDPGKTAPIREYPAPRTLKQVRRFVGMTSWYRKFIENFASLMEPISRLLKTKQHWEWGCEQQTAFEAVKDRLMQAPILMRPDFTKPFTIQVDASTVGLGSVLTQVIDEQERVIAYASRTITDAERNYTTTELECLGVIWSIEKFRGYVEGTHFEVITDHSSLQWLKTLKKPVGRLARWSMYLAAYDVDIIHRKGAMHHVPDALSRMYENQTELNALKESNDDWYESRINDVIKYPKKFYNWYTANGILYHRTESTLTDAVAQDEASWKVVVKQKNRDRILFDTHDNVQSGHLGIEKTHARIAKDYYWPGMFKDIVNYVKHCDICQKIKSEQYAPPGMLGKRIIEHPWSVVAADIMGPFPRSKKGMKYLLVIQDLFTKWIEIEPLRNATGSLIKNALHDTVISRWGTPRVFISDNGTEFVNKVLTEYTKELNVVHSTTPPYHPQANPVERVNRVLKAMIRAFVEQDHRSWDAHILDFRFAFNTSKHSSTQSTPAFLNFGREPLSINSLRRELESTATIEQGSLEQWSERLYRLQAIRDWVVDNSEKAHDRQAAYYNKSHREMIYTVGDKVLMRNRVLSDATKNFAAKLTQPFKGPYTVSKVLSPLVYELTAADNKIVSKIHICDLKPYNSKNPIPA